MIVYILRLGYGITSGKILKLKTKIKMVAIIYYKWITLKLSDIEHLIEGKETEAAPSTGYIDT